MQATTARALLTDIYSSKELSDVMLKIKPEHIRDDVKQHAFLLLFEKDEDFILDLHRRGKLEGYIVRTIYNTANFNEGKFHRELRTFTEKPVWFNEEIYLDREEVKSYESPQIISKTAARIYEKSVQEMADVENEEERESQRQKCKEGVDKLYWYKREIMELYAKHGSYRKVAKETGIPYRSIGETINQVQAEIKKLLWKE